MLYIVLIETLSIREKKNESRKENLDEFSECKILLYSSIYFYIYEMQVTTHEQWDYTWCTYMII